MDVMDKYSNAPLNNFCKLKVHEKLAWQNKQHQIHIKSQTVQ